MKLECPDCGGNKVVTRMIEQEFQYGIAADAVMLKATVPMRICSHCGFQFWDRETEEIHDKVISDYLSQKKDIVK